ncbi:MAG: hypothetical protein F7C81_01075 [Desulfurococcales archaeon]|nr:hypothetical protein [Desulfurococcales archaeon]
MIIVHECINDGIVAKQLASILGKMGLRAKKSHALGKAEALKKAERLCSQDAVNTCVALVDLDPGAPLPKSYQSLTGCLKEVAYRIYACRHRSILILAFETDIEDWLSETCKPQIPPYMLKASHKLFEKRIKHEKASQNGEGCQTRRTHDI